MHPFTKSSFIRSNFSKFAPHNPNHLNGINILSRESTLFLIFIDYYYYYCTIDIPTAINLVVFEWKYFGQFRTNEFNSIWLMMKNGIFIIKSPMSDRYWIKNWKKFCYHQNGEWPSLSEPSYWCYAEKKLIPLRHILTNWFGAISMNLSMHK